MKKRSCLPTIVLILLLGAAVALGWYGVLLGFLGGAVLGAVFFLIKWPLPWQGWGAVGLPFLLADSAARCAPVGALAGLVADLAYDSGNVVGARIAIAVAVAVCWFRVPAQPRESEARPPAPKSEDERAVWASRLSTRFSEQEGLAFASEMINELIRAQRRGKGPVRAALLANRYYRARCQSVSDLDRATAGGYDDSDTGWRWEMVADTPPHIRVSPDPLVRRDGPVFDVHRDWILKRERVGAPGFNVHRSLVPLQRLRADLIETAAELRSAGRWNGDSATLLDALVDALRDHPTRASIVSPQKEGMWTWFKVQWGGSFPALNGYFRPVDADTPTPYHLKTVYSDTSYMVDEHGRWHMALGEATVDDPPPPAFMLDPSNAVP